MTAAALFVQDVMAIALTLAVQAGVCASLFNLRGRSLGVVMLVSLTTTPLLYMIESLQSVTQWVATATHADTLGWLAGGVLPLVLLAIGVAIIDWRLLVWALGPTAGSSRKLLSFAIVMNVVSALLAIPIAFLVFVLTSPLSGFGLR